MTSPILKRLGFAGATVIALGFCAIVAAPFLVPAESARRAVTSQIRALSGQDPVIRGAVTVAFPSATVNLDDIALRDGSGEPLLTAERLTAHLRLLPLLTGNIEISAISLERPRIFIIRGADGSSNWTPLLDALRRALSPQRSARGEVSFSEVRIEDGAVDYDDREHHVREAFSNVTTSLAWPAISKGFAATGRFTWRDQAMDASLNFGNLLAVLTGGQSGLKVRVAGAPLKLAFDGTMSGQPNIKIDGMLSVDGPSIRGVLAWLGQNPGPEGGFGRFALKAQANVNNGTAALAGVNVELDGNAAEGVLTYTTAGRNNLQGTLAADALDLTPYVSTLQFLTNARSWDQRQFSFDEAGNFDVDLRLSAARVAIGNVQLGRSAVALNLRGHQLTLTVGESQAFGGLARGSFTLAKSESGADFKSQMQFAEVDLDKCLGQLFGLRRLEGKGDLAFNVESSGTSIDGLVRALNGVATLSSTKGALAGINVEQLLKRLERRPLSGAGDFRSGRTPYDKIKLAVKITNGIAEVDEMRLDGAVIRLGAGGSFSIPAREFDLKGTASLVSSGGDAAAFELPFMMQGPWDDPILLPDPQILIRRSGAAAPLLEAIKDRKTRETVRSAIERLTAGRQPAAAPAGADVETPQAAAPIEPAPQSDQP